MRGITAAIVCGLVLAEAASAGERTFPYTVEIAADEVEVRCGPGWDYYATQRLARGTKVEVYRHDAGGWLAIRPPEGSFSWVSARHLKPTADRQVAEVMLDGAVAWVGSSTASVAQHKWQVRLKREEQVEVLGELAMTVGPGFATETYQKIGPPAGEFRWIHAQHALAPELAPQQTAARTQSQSDYRHVGQPRVRDAVEPAAAARPLLSAQESARQVEDLRIALALLVTQEIEQWDLSSLKQRADALRQQLVDSSLAREVTAISQRMQEYETLQRRYRNNRERDVSEHRVGGSDSQRDAANAKPDADLGATGPAAEPRLLDTDWTQDFDAAIGSGVAPASAETGASRYDAEGWLMPVHSTKRVAPPFAVLDDDGRVRAYITPAPGLNLRRYAKQYVGLIGTKQYVPALRAAHITAERVVKQDR